MFFLLGCTRGLVSHQNETGGESFLSAGYIDLIALSMNVVSNYIGTVNLSTILNVNQVCDSHIWGRRVIVPDKV